jgi:hypothetical protein
MRSESLDRRFRDGALSALTPRRRARRRKLADRRYLCRPLQRPASNTSDAPSPGTAIDGGGHGGGTALPSAACTVAARSGKFVTRDDGRQLRVGAARPSHRLATYGCGSPAHERDLSVPDRAWPIMINCGALPPICRMSQRCPVGNYPRALVRVGEHTTSAVDPPAPRPTPRRREQPQ